MDVSSSTMARAPGTGHRADQTIQLALIGGSAAFLIGLSLSLGAGLVPETALWAVVQPLIWIWDIGTGISLIRKAGHERARDHASRRAAER